MKIKTEQDREITLNEEQVSLLKSQWSFFDMNQGVYVWYENPINKYGWRETNLPFDKDNVKAVRVETKEDAMDCIGFYTFDDYETHYWEMIQSPGTIPREMVEWAYRNGEKPSKTLGWYDPMMEEWNNGKTDEENNLDYIKNNKLPGIKLLRK